MLAFQSHVTFAKRDYLQRQQSLPWLGLVFSSDQRAGQGAVLTEDSSTVLLVGHLKALKARPPSLVWLQC